MEQIVKDPSLNGPSEALPSYDSMCETLLSEERNDPLISREKLNDLLGERGNLEMLLYDFVKKGFVLHGSPFLTRELEPRKGNDASKNPQNELNAVYVTDVPSVALFMSLHAAKTQPRVSLRSGFSVDNDEGSPLYFPTFRADKDPEEFMGPGYMYVLNRADFTEPHEESRHQLASEKPVRPMLIIPTVVSDFKHEVTKLA